MYDSLISFSLTWIWLPNLLSIPTYRPSFHNSSNSFNTNQLLDIYIWTYTFCTHDKAFAFSFQPNYMLETYFSPFVTSRRWNQLVVVPGHRQAPLFLAACGCPSDIVGAHICIHGNAHVQPCVNQFGMLPWSRLRIP